MPPERNTPSGTSAISRSRTVLAQRAELAHVSAPRPGRRRSTGSDGRSQYRRRMTRPPLERHQRVPGSSLRMPANSVSSRRRVIACREVRERVLVRTGAHQPAREDRLDLGAEQRAVAAQRVVQRLHAETVARQQQRALRASHIANANMPRSSSAPPRRAARTRATWSPCRSACDSAGHPAPARRSVGWLNTSPL